MAIRWLPWPTVGMQRVGAVLAATVAASDNRPVALDGYSRAFIESLSRRVSIPPEHDPEVRVYIDKLALWKRYGNRAATTLEIQDAWLADPALPSATGAVTPAAAKEIPQLAAALRLVRDKNYTLTDRGRAARLLADEHVTSILTLAWRPNPYRISLGLGLFMLHAFLDADGDMVKQAFAHALEAGNPSFKRYPFAVSHLLLACEDLWRQASRRMTSGADLAQIQRLKKLSDSIKETDRTKKVAKTWGGGRTPDQAVTVRLEPYVDLGLLTKPDRFAYEYCMSDVQMAFFGAIAGSTDMDSFIQRDMVAAYLRARGVASPNRIGSDEIWPLMVAAHKDMRSSLGYSAYKELALLVIGRLINEGDGRYFEVADGIQAIRLQQRAAPRTVQLTAARGGELRYIRIVEPRSER